MKHSKLWLLAISIGIVDAVLLFLFELLDIDGTDWLWNTVLRTNEHRWLVLPVAVVLGLVFTAALKALRNTRVVSPKSDLLDEMAGAPTTIVAIVIILAVGAVSLLAGASLGPEAPLMAASAGIGAYAAVKGRLSDSKQLLVLASVGALLVAFLGSLLMMAVPLLVMWQGQKAGKSRLTQQKVVVVLIAGIASFVTLQLLDFLTSRSGGYGSSPALPHLQSHDFWVALVLGFATSLIALSLNWVMGRFYEFASRFDSRELPSRTWFVGAVFGFILGVAYLFGGQTVEFSGKVGSEMLAANAAHYSAAALLGLVIVKLLATAWSKGSGYRGGLVFPSIYIGVAFGLFVGSAFGSLAGAGAMIGSTAGILTAMVGSPVISAIFLLAVLPFRSWIIALFAIAGTLIFDRLVKLRPSKGTSSAKASS